MVCARVTWLHGLRACHVVTWFARVSRGYMVCARVTWLHGLRACHVVTWFARVSHGYVVCTRARVTWLHGLPIVLALALARVAGSVSFNAVAFLVIIVMYVLILLP